MLLGPRNAVTAPDAGALVRAVHGGHRWRAQRVVDFILHTLHQRRPSTSTPHGSSHAEGALDLVHGDVLTARMADGLHPRSRLFLCGSHERQAPPCQHSDGEEHAELGVVGLVVHAGDVGQSDAANARLHHVRVALPEVQGLQLV